MDITLDYARLVDELERQELQSCGGIASPTIYGQLLAIYLLTNDLPNAKLLWKRIVPNIKSENSELVAIWEIAKKLWNREFSAIYQLIENYEWPNHLKNIMKCISETTRKRALNLISKGFTSIRLEEVSHYVGQSVSETADTVTSMGWNVDLASGFVSPTKPSLNNEEISSSEEQLGKLTEYVAFLEN